jgi:hypothetical protein
MNLLKVKNWIINYLFNFTMALDCFLNAVFGGLYNEQISLRVANAEKRGKKWACYFCKFLHWIDRNHCDRTLRGERTGYGAGFRFLVLLSLLFYLIFMKKY